MSSPLHLLVGSLQVALSLHSIVAVGGGHSPFVQSTVIDLLQEPALGGSLGRH